MPFDGLAMRAVTEELKNKLIGGRVEKALQPERDEVHLVFRNNYENFRLLISASASYARVHLTSRSKLNPDRAPMFCMVLRKHLIGGKLLSVEQAGLERVLCLRFGVIDELGLSGELVLHIEVMGKHSNAVLVRQDGTILDALKRVTEEKSRVREVLPGIPYDAPPSQGKRDPLELRSEALLELLAASTDKPIWQALCGGLEGLAQATGKELLKSCGLDPGLSSSEFSGQRLETASCKLAERFSQFAQGCFEPCVLERNSEVIDFYTFHPESLEGLRGVPGMSEAADAAFAQRDLMDRLKQNGSNMTHVLGNALKRAEKKLEKQSEELRDSSGLEILRLKGELLTANLHLMRKSQKSVDVVNYYSEEGETLTVELDPTLTPSENAQAYFKKYAKAKSTQEKLSLQMEATRQEIEYIEGQLQNIAQSSSVGELEEIRVELAAQGYQREAAKQRRKIAPSKPRHYRSADGHDIYVGRNNAQNDFLTLKFARGDDVWMHTKKIPGSHVIVRAVGGAVSQSALETGAMLAAYFSRAKTSSSVPVDYTQKKNVKKPAGARPGYVIYLTNQTLVVTPDEDTVSKLAELKE